jgi:YlmC/YmxH family sporulation protein
MQIKFSELRCKEVICVADGRRLGFVSDVEVTIPEGVVRCVIVPGPCRFFGILGRKDDYVIPWCAIRRIGPDIILVDIQPDDCCMPRFKPGWL